MGKSPPRPRRLVSLQPAACSDFSSVLFGILCIQNDTDILSWEEVPLIPLSINHRKRWLGRETARYPSCCHDNCPCYPCRLRQLLLREAAERSLWKQLISHISQEAAEGSLRKQLPSILNPGITAWGENVASSSRDFWRNWPRCPLCLQLPLSKSTKIKTKKIKKRECSWGLKSLSLTCHCQLRTQIALSHTHCNRSEAS